MNVFAIEVAEDQLDGVTKSMYHHLKMLIEERDGYVDEIREMSQTLEELYQEQQENEVQKMAAAALAPPAASPEKHHLAVELAEGKAKLRKLRQELEEKTEQFAESQEELEELRSQLAKLRTENLELMQDARAARAYRDELDIMKEKASRVDKYETEVAKYKERLNEMEFYKSRVEELREDNALMTETKNILEDQLSNFQGRFENIAEIETDLVKYKQQLENVILERDSERISVKELLEENTRLEFEKKSSFNESATLEEELVRARSQLNLGASNNLSDQLNETTNTKVLRLELENQRLQKQLASMKENTTSENVLRTTALEKENKRLSIKVESLQESSSKEANSIIQMEQVIY